MSDESSSESEESASDFEDSREANQERKKDGREVKNMPFDEELEVSASMDASMDPSAAKDPKKMKNRPFDEALSIASDDSDGSVSTNASPKGKADVAKNDGAGARAAPQASAAKQAVPKPQAKPVSSKPAAGRKADGDSDEESSSEEDDDEEEDASQGSGSASRGATASKDGYNPADFAGLNVSAEVRELFQYIGRYKPHDIELETRLKCFIPDYIPSVGEIDAFLKVPRPDGQRDELGLKVLDEPAAIQSDPTVLDLQMRAISKKQHGEAMVRSIDNADKNPREITKWINSINDLHRSKPPPQVHYSKNMPDIESLMQEWPAEFETLLSEIQLPGVEMDLSTKEYARLVCSILDIPVYGNMIESLHVLFTLYCEFKNNQHFNNIMTGAEEGDGMGGMQNGMNMGGTQNFK